MKIEWLAINVTAVVSPDRAKCAILGMILAELFWPIQAVYEGRGPLLDVGTSS